MLRGIDRCRVCGSERLVSVLDLGPQYVASAFIRDVIDEQLERPYPLELVRCSGPGRCGLVQLRHSVPSRLLYHDYGYQSGITQLMRDNLRTITREAEACAPLKPGDTVLDIGCNDGTLLCSYSVPSLDRLGFDPAENVALLARAKGLEVLTTYFSASAYSTVRPKSKPRVITTIAMFYDLPDPCAFAREIASILAKDGLWIMEMSYFPTMFSKRLFDTICHEHLEYYSLEQIHWIMNSVGLSIHRVEFNDVNGGSFRLLIRHASFGPAPAKDAAFMERVGKVEESLHLHNPDVYIAFKRDIDSLKSRLRSLLSELQASGKRVYAYGASTKGNTILQFCELDSTWVPKAADRNPDKWGRRTLGTSIPIISEEDARREKPDYFLILPWHFLSEFIQREASFLAGGGQFIVPLPKLEVIRQDLKTGAILRT